MQGTVQHTRPVFHVDMIGNLAYPLAALGVAHSDYADFTHHYVAIGKARGHRPLPDR